MTDRHKLLAALLLIILSGCTGLDKSEEKSDFAPASNQSIRLPQLPTMSQALTYYAPLTPTIMANQPWEGDSIIEVSGLFDQELGTCEFWYRAGPTGREAIGYARSLDSSCRRWEKLLHPVLTADGGVLMPHVFKRDGQYWMLAKRNADGGFWLYRSADKFNWTLAQSRPILSPPGDRSAWDYEMHNPTLLLRGDEGYVFYEGANGTHWAFQVGAIPVRWSSSGLELAGARSGSPLFGAEEVFWRWASIGNPDIVHVPERKSVMLLAGGMPPAGVIQSGEWIIGCAVANDMDDLANRSSWKDCPNFLLLTEGVHLADPSMVVVRSGGQTHLTMLYSWAQKTIHSAHANLTLGQFYDSMMVPAPGGGAAAKPNSRS